jgi:peptidoglycan hydrolase CwlO-like protein
MIHTKELFADGKTLDDKSLEMLTKVIEENNLPGFDYYEFKRSVAMLKTMSLDEATAHKSAFQTASTMGLTKEKLIETAQYYRNLMDKESAQFMAALETQNKTRVSDKQVDVKRLQDQVSRHEAEVARLQEEIATYKQQVAQTEQNIVTEGEKLNQRKEAFESTLKSIALVIEADIEKMHQYL